MESISAKFCVKGNAGKSFIFSRFFPYNLFSATKRICTVKNATGIVKDC